MDERGSLLAAMQRAMGPMPEEHRRVPLDVRIEGDDFSGPIRRTRLTFATEAGDRCSAWLLLPSPRAGEPQRRRPAALCLHQTTAIGKDEPAGLGGLANLHYGLELALRGYVALCPDYPGFGGYPCRSYDLGYASNTMKGIWNHCRAVDLLCSLPEVDPARIACVGHSLGGHNTLFVAAFEPRIAAAVSSCGFTLFAWNDHDGQGLPGDVRDWSHNGYMPWIRERFGGRAENMPFDFDGVLRAIAPRAVFVNAPVGDAFAVAGVVEAERRLRPVFAAAGVSDRFVVVHPPGGHDFPPSVRAEAYAFLDRVLGR